MNKTLKIVKILDEYNVIINAGTSNGVLVGNEFQILDKKGSPVIDPDTNEEIGYLDLVKATVQVTEVQEKMCVCTSPEYNIVQAGIFDIQTFNHGFTTKKRDKLNIDNKQITGGLSKSNALIQVGDEVKLVNRSK